MRTILSMDAGRAVDGGQTKPTRRPLLCLLLIAGISGCVGGPVVRPEGHGGDWVSATALAEELGMQLGRTSRYSAALNNASNSLLITGPPRPSVILNGRKLSDGSGVVEREGELLIDRALAGQIRSLLGRPPVRLEPHPPVQVSPQPVSGTVVIDPGHGGRDPGAPNRYGPSESILVLDASLRLAERLRARGIHVVMTRSDDTFVELNDRAEIANRIDADLFVSVHADSHPDSEIDGFTLYVARGAPQRTRALAEAVAASMKREVPVFRGIREAAFRVLVRTRMPAILVEMGYLTNRSDAMKLGTAAYRQRLAEAMAEGIDTYLQNHP